MVSIVVILFVAFAIFGCLGVIVTGLLKSNSAIGRWLDVDRSA
jgi:hypothetical protein